MTRRIIAAAVILGLALVFSERAAEAASAREIDARVKAALERFSEESPEGKELAGEAEGYLVFPKVLKAGLGIGGEYGEGALIVDGKTVAYYSIAGASIGFQIGAQKKSEVILFMEDYALEDFQESDGWEAGIDGSVAVADMGAGGEIDTETLKEPIIGFIFSNKGLMYNLTFEGQKITKLDKKKKKKK